MVSASELVPKTGKTKTNAPGSIPLIRKGCKSQNVGTRKARSILTHHAKRKKKFQISNKRIDNRGDYFL